MRGKSIGIGTVRFKARTTPSKVIVAEVRPALKAMSAGAVIGDNYTPGAFISAGGTVVSQTPTYLVNGQVRDANHVASSGEELRISVVVVDSAGNTKTFSTLALPVAVREGFPVISGTPQPAQTLTAIGFSFPGIPPFTFQYQWQRSLRDIAGQTASTYLVQDGDATLEIRVAVRSVDSQGTLSDWRYSDPVSIDFAIPTFSVQPTLNAATYVSGAVVTLTIGTASAPITITEFANNGISKIANLVLVNATTYTWTSTGEPAGAITFTTTSTNSAGATVSNRITASLTVGVAAAPAQFGAGDWSVANQGAGGIARFTINPPLPSNGGSPPTAIQYQIGVAAFVASGILSPGTFDVPGFVNGAATDTSVRMVNTAGSGIAAAVKSVTTSDTVAPEIISAIYDTPTNALTVTTSEAAKKYYMVNSSPTQLTGAAIKAAVNAGTPIAFATMLAGVAEVTPNFGALGAATYSMHMASEDAAINVEALGKVVTFDWTGAADVVAPTLSLPTGASNGATASTGTVTTNEANGTLYAIDSTSATPATGAQIIAGLMNTGAAAAGAATPQSISATGEKTVPIGTVPASTTLYRQYVHRDAASNTSNVVVSASYTTPAPSAGVIYVGSTLMVSTSTSGVSFNSTTDHTVSALANRAVILEIRGYNDVVGVPSITSCDFGGVAMEVVQAPFGSSARAWVALYMLKAPASGAKNCALVVSTTQRAMSIRVIEVRNVEQTTGFVAAGTSNAGATFVNTVSFTRTTVNNGNMLLSALAIDVGNLAAGITAGGGATLIAGEQTGTTGSSDVSAGSAYEAVPTAGAEGHSYSWATTEKCALAWVEMKAV